MPAKPSGKVPQDTQTEVCAPVSTRPPRPFFSTFPTNHAQAIRFPAINLTRKERAMGIEPTPPAWKAGALPLSYARMFHVFRNLTPGKLILPDCLRHLFK